MALKSYKTHELLGELMRRGKSLKGEEVDGMEVALRRGSDGRLIVEIDGPGDSDTNELGAPDIRIWLNDALIYRHGETGDNLSWP